MQTEIIHIVPFDTGTSFNTYSNLPHMRVNIFIEKLKHAIVNTTYELTVNQQNQRVCTLTLPYNVMCYIMNNGIGLFVFSNKSLQLEIPEEVANAGFPIDTYYRKKFEQQAILDGEAPHIAKLLSDCKRIIWNSCDKKLRATSACSNYKYGGFSYVYSIYHVTVEDQSEEQFQQQLYHLLTPTLFQHILSIEDFGLLREKLHTERAMNGELTGVEVGESTLYATWSGAAIVSTERDVALELIINNQLQIQSTWFLFDCTIDHIQDHDVDHLALRQLESVLKFAKLTSMTNVSANMSTAEQHCFQLLYETSGIEDVMKRATLLIENRLHIEEQKIVDSQRMFSKLAEILLATIAILSLYDPIKNMFQSGFQGTDLYIILALIIAIIIVAILLLKKRD